MAKDYKKKIADMRLEAGKLMTKDQIAQCNVAIHTAAVAAGAAGFIPVPVADAVPISAAQVVMVVSLGKIFDQTISDSAAKGLIGAAASTLVGRSLVKLIPVVGWVASASVAAGVTEAIGWSIAFDFAKKYRTEYQRKKNAEDAAKAYAEAEYYKKKAESGSEHNDEEVEDFSI
jgi:uncharacterized protein (DUF697 family)